MKEEMIQQVQNLAVEEFTRAGWKGDRLLPHVLNKVYATAVGPKEATVRADVVHASEIVWLNAVYWSEGRNVAATCYAFLASTADKEVVISKVERFLADVEKAIAGSYAVKLLHPLTPGQALEGEVLPPESELMSRGRQLLDDIARETRAIENIARR